MTDLVVGVDLGSSSARAVAIDCDGKVQAEGVARYAGTEDWPPGHADPFALLAAFEDATTQLGLAHVEALAIGGQSPTTVLADGADALTCLHPAGATLDPHSQHGEQFRVLREEHGDAASRAEGSLAPVEPMQLWDWVLMQLGAPRAQGRWPGDPELPGYGGIVRTGTVAGKATGAHGIAAGTPLVPGAQDAYLAFWAAGIDEPGRALDPGGRTGGLGVAVAAGARPPDMFGLPAAAQGIDIVGGPVSAHGLILEWWADMTGTTVDELLALAARVPPGANGVLALPYLEGERAPRWNRDLRAELVGLGSDTGKAEVARALLEGTAYGLAHIARELEAHGVTTHTLVVGGSPARSRLWCEIKASVFGVPVEVSRYPELASFGAALAAGAAAGWWPAPGAGRAGDWPRPEVRVISPEPCDAYRVGYRRFVELGDAAVRRQERAGAATAGEPGANSTRKNRLEVPE